MLPPEIVRIVLLIGLAATGYMMILAWTDDRQAMRAPIEYSDRPIVSSDVVADAPIDTTNQPIAGESDSMTVSDVPDESMLSEQPVLVAPADATERSSGRLVQVATNTLNVWIDLEGGDIVRVQLKHYPVSLDQMGVPYQLLERSVARTYVAQSGLIGPHGPDSQGRPMYQVRQSMYDILQGEEEVVLTTEHDGVPVKKIYTFRADDHLMDVRYEMTNSTNLPLRAAFFSQIKRDARPPAADESFSMGMQAFVGAALTTPEERYLKVEFEDVDEGRIEHRVDGGWIAFLQHYFLAAWVSPEGQANRFFAKKAGGNYFFGFTGPPLDVAPAATGVWKAQFYAGPKDQKRLEEISPNLNLTIDYGFLWWLAIPLFALLDWLHGLVGNWGAAIIMLTIIVKAVLYPLSAAGYKSMANMRRVAPQMKKIQERYANDRERLSKEMMGLYKKEGANPLGGCLPMLLPMPIFIALYWVLFESVELRLAPFMFWIEDLAQMDPFFILPLLMGASTYYMQSLNPQVGDPMQQKMMKMMPIMFTVLFLFFPAGLVLYWLVNNVLSIAQQQFVYRKAEKAQA